MRLLWLSIVVICGAVSSVQNCALGQGGGYDGIQAGADAYRLGEERRQANLQQQLGLNQDLRSWSGIPGYGGTVTYDGGPTLRPAYGNLDSLYGYGNGYIGPTGVTYGARDGWIPPVFEPWPYVPGDIWGYGYNTPWRQPIGRWEGQTGPNRWESHPVYDRPITPYEASPPVNSPLLDGTPYATPRPQVAAPIVNQPSSPTIEDEAEIIDEFDLPRQPATTPSRSAPPRRGPREF